MSRSNPDEIIHAKNEKQMVVSPPFKLILGFNRVKLRLDRLILLLRNFHY